MSSLACNIVILPNQELASFAINVSQGLTDKGVLFALEDQKFYPHVSVYMLQLKTEDLPTVQQLLATVAGQCHGLTLEANGYDQSMQFLDAEYIKNTEITTLQAEVIRTLNPIRDGMRTKDIARMQAATGLALENYKQYGWNTVGDLYRPHMTLTRFEEDQEIADLKLPDVTKLNGSFPGLGLFEMGDNGTCVRKIVEFTFGTQ